MWRSVRSTHRTPHWGAWGQRRGPPWGPPNGGCCGNGPLPGFCCGPPNWPGGGDCGGGPWYWPPGGGPTGGCCCGDCGWGSPLCGVDGCCGAGATSVPRSS